VLGGNVGMSQAEIDASQSKILDTGMKFGKDPTEIVEGLAVGQERFNLLKELTENIDAITAAAKSSQGTVPEFVGMVGSVVSAFGLAKEEIPKALDIMMGAARAGAVNPGDFAASFAASAGIFATNTGQRGMAGLRQFVGTSQGIGAGQFGAAESATRLERLATDLNDSKVIEALKPRGVDVKGKDGKIDVGSVLEQIANSKDLQTSTQRQQVFKEVRALQGLDTLLAQRQKVLNGEVGAVDFNSMSREGLAAEGAAGTARVLGMLESEGVLDLQRQAIEMQKHTIENLKTYNDQVIAMTKATNNLEKSFGSLSLWASSIGIGGGVAAGGALLGKLTGGGAVAGAGGAGLLATLGTGLASLGAGTIAAGVLAGGVIGGGLGYGADKLTEKMTGEKLSDHISDWLSKDLIAQREAINPTNLGMGTEASLRVEVDVQDNRTHVKTSSKSKGGKVSVGSGPLMPGAM
jgi:hypothetical protein